MGEAKAKQLTLICSQINARDYIPTSELNGATFNDLIEFLYKKYEEPIIAFASDNVGNLVPSRDRIPLKFEYPDDSGQMITAAPSEAVVDVMQLNDTINWTIEPMGGCNG